MNAKQAKARIGAITHRFAYNLHYLKDSEIEILLQELNKCREVLKNDRKS